MSTLPPPPLLRKRAGAVGLFILLLALALLYFRESSSSLLAASTFSTTVSKSSRVDGSSWEKGEEGDEDDDYAAYSEDSDTTNFKPDNEDNKYALEKLIAFLDKTKQYPVIVGGIGDSGTRGIRSLLRELGVEMLSAAYINNFGDSNIFIDHYPVYDAESNQWADRHARLLYKMAIHRTRTLSYNHTAFSDKGWEWGRQFIGTMLTKSKAASLAMRSANNKPLGVWGMKHPRTMYLLPFIVSALGHRVKFIHVVRDPRYIVSGRNQKMFMDGCHRYYGGGPDLKCPKTLVKRYQFWADTNWDVYQFALRNMSKDSYMVVRTEDFVNGDLKCYQRIAKFVGVDDQDQNRLQRAMDTCTPHRGRYFGTEMPDRLRAEVMDALQKSSPKLDIYNREDVKRVTQFFGYGLRDFSLTKTCLDLPFPAKAP